ncbi:alginate lyase family protein [Colwellia sp. 12G3]|uniref:alginate lyase family protein n=1 Tax=Colwellia sp. 12G3 TaxID=2058299 RepID=UPI000C33E8D3|nr:alginate lyase family protein [Colwellia sp. 12G3]PKI17063.1 hypothetical protein CXF71_07470 [Colwellia sp. 12G3]
MKNQQFSVLLLSIIFILSIQTTYAAMNFIHPGATNSKANLDFIKQQISNNKQPWLTEFNRLKKSALLSRKPHALQTVNSKNNNESAEMRDDAIAAYSLALMWVITDREVYAKRAIAILNAWASFKGFTSCSDQDKLQAGWTGAVFASAGELMRLYQGWPQNQVLNVQLMFKKAFYPQLLTASSWNGNVDLTQIDALISIAVFNDDEEAFNMALTRLSQRNPAYFYLTSDGKRGASIQGDGGNIEQFWSKPTQWVDGLNQETCRDNGHHSQYALASALHVAEVAWNQGVDVYSENQLRYTEAMELMAKQLLSNDFFTCQNTQASKNYFNTWEIGFNHYHNRQGIQLPYTQKLIINKIRPNSMRTSWNVVYETLTHANLPKP